MATIIKILSRNSPTTIALSDYVGAAGEFLLDPDTGQIRFQDGSTEGGIPIGGGGDGSLAGFESAIITEAPNDTLNLSVLAAEGGSTSPNQSITILPAGQGAFMLSIPTNDSNGGNARGEWAVDLQIFANGKQSPTQVASGTGCFAAGAGNTSSGLFSSVLGYSNISSGIGSHAEGQGTTSSSDGTHAEGQNTSATNSYAHAEGLNTVASGQSSHASGSSTTASGAYAISCGTDTVADADGSIAMGNSSITRGIAYYQVYSTGAFGSPGDNQSGRLRLIGFTGSSAAAPLTTNSEPASTDNQLTIPESSACAITGTVLGRDFLGNNAMFTFTALLKCDSGGTVAIVGSPTVTQLYADTAAETWTVTIAADESDVAFRINVTGVDGVDVRWTAEIRTQEIVY